MRKRTIPHIPAVSSTAYQCGKLSLHLLPGATLAAEVGVTLNRLGVDSIDGYAPSMLLNVLLIAALWDDPDIELEARPPWIDNLLSAPIADLRMVGLRLIAEIHGRGARALGVDSLALIQAANEAMEVTGESPAASGTASTSG